MTDLHNDAEWLESIASDWHHDRERARFRAIAARLDRAAALEAGLRELETRWRGNDALRAMVADAERRGDHIELLRSTIFWELRESHARQVAALMAEHGSES